MVKGGSIGLGIRSMLSDFEINQNTKLVIKVDSSAAIGISSRRGLGKVRHIDVADLTASGSCLLRRNKDSQGTWRP